MKSIHRSFVISLCYILLIPCAAANEPRNLEEALLNYTWAWINLRSTPSKNPANDNKEVKFFKDGTATTSFAKNGVWRWKITGPRTVHLDFGPGGEGDISFDDLFTKFGGKNVNNPGTYTGRRLANLTPTVISPAAAVPAAIQTDPNQPRIEVLKDQAPNAIEWALAPLEQAVPGDIRQNLTFLREDLLTETQDKPKLSATSDAGAKLCDAIIGVLDERKLTLAKAGFRAVEASARTSVTSQALEARRNYKMSWPQFAREESQRAELKSQAIGNAQVMAERPKLDWAQRTAALQKPLDDLYRQYCEALRQSAK